MGCVLVSEVGQVFLRWGASWFQRVGDFLSDGVRVGFRGKTSCLQR